jgi:glycosyltransferase involved in cell wall biosynthesis
MTAISVLLPCYNAAATLPEALDSLAAQTFADFEIVAIDDGSTDDTPAILRTWAARQPRLKIVTRPHGGIVQALNAGWRASSAPLLARMDADDRCHPQRLERQAAYLREHAEVAVLGCQVTGFPAAELRGGFQVYIAWSNGLISDAELRREMFVESPLVHPSVMMRRAWLEQIGGYQDHGWAEDYDLWLRLYLAGARFYKLPEVLLEWRESPGRLTRADSRYSLENFIRAKAHYLARGPLAGRDAVILWGAGMMGRRLSKQLQRERAPLAAFVDIDPAKIGRTRRGLPILPPEGLMDLWQRYRHPVVLAAVAARGARQLICQRLETFGLREGQDWWSAA